MCPVQDTSILTELGQLSPEAVPVSRNLVRYTDKRNLRPIALVSYGALMRQQRPTSLSSLASLSLSSSMVMSSRGCGANGVGHGGGRGRCNGGDRERLISCSRKAEWQIKKVRKGKNKTNNTNENTYLLINTY